MTNKEKENRQSLSKAHAARQQKRRYPFTPKTRLFDLTTASSHTTLAAWLAFIAAYLKDGKVPDWKTATRLDFHCSKERIVWCIGRCCRQSKPETTLFPKSKNDYGK